MDKKIVLAVAGSGKTYHLCNCIDPDKRNLIIAFTNENIHNIVKEVVNRFGYIPKHTDIMTFHRFVYHNCIRPYEWFISQAYGIDEIKSKGVCLIEPPEQRIKGKSNPLYVVDSKIEHYYTKDLNKVFCSRMSELACKTKIKRVKLLKFIVDRIKKFYDYLYIDEFQDFREYDYDLLEYIIKNINNLLLVGDYYQHSVSGKNNSGKPFKNGRDYIGYDDYLKLIKLSLSIDADTTTLIKSRRCKKSICEYINKKTGIAIEPLKPEEQGEIKIITAQDEIIKILKNDKIKKLVWQDSNKYKINCINWGACKGNTYNETCVILTDTLKGLLNDEFDSSKFDTPISLNKLYVALSRSSGDVNIVTYRDFKQAIGKI